MLVLTQWVSWECRGGGGGCEIGVSCNNRAQPLPQLPQRTLMRSGNYQKSKLKVCSQTIRMSSYNADVWQIRHIKVSSDRRIRCRSTFLMECIFFMMKDGPFVNLDIQRPACIFITGIKIIGRTLACTSPDFEWKRHVHNY